MAEHKQYKDALFRHLFNDKKNILDLYGAASGDYSLREDDIELVTLDYAFDNGRKNDLAFIHKNQLIVLAEHQSTVNKNMMLRFFLYLAQYYDKEYSGDKLYGSKRIILPEPRFYVFYIGDVEKPEHWTERLSESFESKNSEWIDLKAEWYNINKSAEGEILQRSVLLYGYSIFVGKVKKYKDSGMDRDIALTRALDECIAAGILADFLNKNKEEIKTMFNTRWNMEDAMRVLGNECREEGFMEGEAKGEAKGEARGREEGMAIGEARGTFNTTLASVRNMVIKLQMTADAAMDVLNVAPADRPAILAAL